LRFERKVKDCGLSKTATIEKIDSFDIAVDVEGSKKGSAPKSVVDYAISKRESRKIFIPPDQRIDKLIETFLGEDYEKLKSYPQIFQLIKEKGGDEQKAIQYANKLEEYHREHSPDKPVYLSNPSTEVSQLIIKLNELAELRKPINPSQMGDISQTDLKNADYPFKDDELTNTLLQLINEQYSQETKARKVAVSGMELRGFPAPLVSEAKPSTNGIEASGASYAPSSYRHKGAWDAPYASMPLSLAFL